MKNWLMIVVIFSCLPMYAQQCYSCVFSVPRFCDEIVDKVKKFDSVILFHSCDVQGCEGDFRGVGYIRKEIDTIRLWFPREPKTGRRGACQIAQAPIKDAPWKNELKHFNASEIYALPKDSLDLDERKYDCIVFDGGSDEMIWIKKQKLFRKRTFEPLIHQQCHPTIERAKFIAAIALLLRGSYLYEFFDKAED